MCFSSSASFLAAVIAGGAGVFALSGVRRPAEIPLASLPLVLAGQQAVEGLLWRKLAHGPETTDTGALSLSFLLLAEFLWPVLVPMAAYLAEPREDRRRLMAPWLALGSVIGAYLLWVLVSEPHAASISGSRIDYVTHPYEGRLVALGYAAATILPLLHSSHRWITALGLIVLTGLLVSYFAYREALVSVWCYFATLGSGVVAMHFTLPRAERAAPPRGLPAR